MPVGRPFSDRGAFALPCAVALEQGVRGARCLCLYTAASVKLGGLPQSTCCPQTFPALFPGFAWCAPSLPNVFYDLSVVAFVVISLVV